MHDDTVLNRIDRCWDLLRQRRARRTAGGDSDDARVRDADIVEHYGVRGVDGQHAMMLPLAREARASVDPGRVRGGRAGVAAVRQHARMEPGRQPASSTHLSDDAAAALVSRPAARRR